jgi:uncharacterized membrane protein
LYGSVPLETGFHQGGLVLAARPGPVLMGNWGRAPLLERLSNTFLKPPKPGSAAAQRAASGTRSVEELEYEVRHASDKERLIGLLAAPIAAAVGFLVVGTLVANDPASKLANGLPNKLHTNASTWYDLLAVLAALSIVMVTMALLRKRLYLGMAMALYGLTIFNLHYWGFGIPFIMCAAWFLVRSYRAQRDLKEAQQGTSSASYRVADGPRRPGANRRYTPPGSARRSAARPGAVSKNRSR